MGVCWGAGEISLPGRHYTYTVRQSGYHHACKYYIIALQFITTTHLAIKRCMVCAWF